MFGIPHKIVTDNGTPFVNKDVRKLLDHHHIKHRRSTPYYPQGNGQAKATNRMLLRILSKMVHEYEGGWIEHLLETLWAYQSSSKIATGLSPFSLVYGTEAISPVELLVPTPRVVHGQETDVSKAMKSKVFVKGQMVLKVADHIKRNLSAPSKFAPSWEGPYLIKEVSVSGYYRLPQQRVKISRNLSMANGLNCTTLNSTFKYVPTNSLLHGFKLLLCE